MMLFTARSELRKVLFLAMFVTSLFVYEISRGTAEWDLCQIHRKTCLVPRLDEFECQR